MGNKGCRRTVYDGVPSRDLTSLQIGKLGPRKFRPRGAFLLAAAPAGNIGRDPRVCLGETRMIAQLKEATMSIRLLPMAGAVLLTAAPVLAQPVGLTPPETGQVQPETQAVTAGRQAGMFIPTEDPSHVRVEKLLGMKVVNPAGEEVGIVDDIVFDKDGKVSGLVIEAGGLMGIGGKPIGVAWRDVGSALTSNVIRISLTKDDIDSAPPFKASDENSKTQAPRQPVGLVPLQPDPPRR